MKKILVILAVSTSSAFANYQIICSKDLNDLNRSLKNLENKGNIVDVSAPSISIAKAAPAVTSFGGHLNPKNFFKQTKVETTKEYCVTVKLVN